ncbi:response regulator [Mesoterricola sediminis]|uniref:Signal transduction protein n=1 Tax=Mesoterricola sediminis TaxID=2927980 RepID=A0AA48GUB8_9BACT|nr:response regulator [Mesoterricola sediminis]BDU77757.1 signal transduction protein [Mesoterricola sediminis]
MTGRTRILFVDDEPLVLQALERQLRGLRGEWDMAFADSGERALERLSLAPFDVVVADLGMPGMDGTAFLGQVMNRYPGVVRLILTGHSSAAQMLHAEGVAHQYLAKPCEPETLRAVIRSAAGTASAMRNEAVRRILGGVRRLPALPAAYQEIQTLLEEEDVKIADLGRVVKRDPGLAANVLKVVNSAYFGLRQHVSDPADAVAYLGIDTLKGLALVHGVFGQVTDLPAGFSVGGLWSHCLQVALASRGIARHERLPREVQGDCFTGGLLHDVGLLILASALPDAYGAVRGLMASGQDIVAAEMSVLGVHHGEVGAWILGLWALPAPVVQAVAAHHAPPDLDPPGPAGIVSAVEVLSAAHGDGAVFGLVRDPDPGRVQALLGPRAEAWTAALESPD